MDENCSLFLLLFALFGPFWCVCFSTPVWLLSCLPFRFSSFIVSTLVLLFVFFASSLFWIFTFQLWPLVFFLFFPILLFLFLRLPPSHSTPFQMPTKKSNQYHRKATRATTENQPSPPPPPPPLQQTNSRSKQSSTQLRQGQTTTQKILLPCHISFTVEAENMAPVKGFIGVVDLSLYWKLPHTGSCTSAALSNSNSSNSCPSCPS